MTTHMFSWIESNSMSSYYGFLLSSMLTGGSDCRVCIYDIEEPIFRERNMIYPVMAHLDR